MIYLANDHAGFALMEQVKEILTKMNQPFEHVGAMQFNKTDSYVDFAKLANQKIDGDTSAFGIYSCGTGVGISIAANRDKNVRAALVTNEKFAMLARKDDNANVLVLPGRFMSKSKAKRIIKVFLATEFEGGRHTERVNALSSMN